MDNDSSIEDVVAEDTLENFNVRFTGTSAQEDFDGTNIESTSALVATRHSGINQGIGATGFERTRKGYGFVYNSLGYHQIVEINYDTEAQTVLFENKTNSGGIDVLPLNPKYYVNDIKLINGFLFAFTDSFGEPYYVDIDRLKSGGYGVLTGGDFKLIKAQPMVLPVATYNNDGARSTNLLRGNLFQPIEQYVYLNNEYSAWSSMGKRPVPTTESTPATGTVATKDNNLIVIVDAGTNRVITLNIGMRIGLMDFFLVKSISRADVIAITATEVNVTQEIYEAYNPATNKYSFAFYNDGLYPNIDVLETDLAYDYVPIKAGAMEVINGSILALGDITEGYARPTIDVSITQTSYEPNIAFTNPPASNLLNVVTWSQDRPKGVSYRRVTVVFGGLPQTGDVITIITANLDGVVYNTPTFTVTALQAGNLLLAIKALAAVMTYPTSVSVSGSQVTLKFSTRRESETPDGKREEMKGYTLTLVNAGTGESKSIPALKTNSSYQLALAVKDDKGRYFPIATGVKFVTKTQSFAQLTGLTPKIHWVINNAVAPVGGSKYQWLLSENNTHEDTLWMNAILDTTSTNAEYFVFKINSLLKFNTNNSSSVLSYGYTIGDRATFVYELTAGVKTYFDKIDVEVSGFEIVIDTVPNPDVTNYLLKVAKPSAITQASITGKNLLLEIYTPKKRASISGATTTYTDQVFYEIGEQFDIVNGNFSVLSGDIKDGDIYLKTRVLANAVDPNNNDTYIVEDFNFSDFYPSKFTSYGRARTFNDIRGQVRKMASIRYSDTFLEGNLVNGITRFFAERIYGDNPGETSSNYGAINKLVQVGNYLVCIQDTKTGSIPVNISIIEDQTAQSNVAVSDRLLNYIRYSSAGNFGMGGCKESFAQRPDGTIYFVDPNNSLPIRIGQDGTSVISAKMTKFFRATLQSAFQQGRKIIGIYDIFNDEYMIGIQQGGDVLTSFVFSAANWRYEDTYVIPANGISLAVQGTKGVATYNTGTGISIYTPNAGQTGADSYTFSFTPSGGSLTTKRVCLTILAGDDCPNVITFTDITNAVLSQLYVSNAVLIIDIDIPSPISITAPGQYRINGIGAWTSASGTVVNEDYVEVRVTSSASGTTPVSTTLTVGCASDTYTVTTLVVPTTTTTIAPTTTTTIAPTTTTTGAPTTTTTGSPTTTTTGAPTTTTTTTASVLCGSPSAYSGGISYPTTQSVVLGAATGAVMLSFNAITVPDRFIVEWNGSVQIDTGYRGGSDFDFGGASRASFNSDLTGRIDPILGVTYPNLANFPADGYPRVTSPGNGFMSFNKSLASPSTATVKVYAPMVSTAWDYTMFCPGITTTTTTTLAPTTTTTTAAPTFYAYLLYGYSSANLVDACNIANPLMGQPVTVYAAVVNPFAVIQFFNDTALTNPWTGVPNIGDFVSFALSASPSSRYHGNVSGDGLVTNIGLC